MSSKAKQILLWLMIISSALLFVYFIQRNQGKSAEKISYNRALTTIKNKDISEVFIKQNTVELTNKNKEKFYTELDSSDSSRDSIVNAVNKVNEENPDSITYNFEQASSGIFWVVLMNALPFLLLVGFLIFTLRQMQAGGNKALSFGTARYLQ